LTRKVSDILAKQKNPPRELSSQVVLARCVMRISILLTFALLGSAGFGTSFAALSAMASPLCAIIAVVRREAAFRHSLNHWDEAAAYAALYFLTVGVGLSAPL
jgi:hypothetical protein